MLQRVMDMIRTMRKPYLWFILSAEAIGLLSGWISREGIRLYPKITSQAPLAPPGWVFPVVWVILYFLMGFGAARVWESPPGRYRSAGLNLYVLQLVLNFFWSPIFFRAGNYGFALVWLLLLLVAVSAMALAFGNAEATAGRLQIPYLLCLLFAAYLNYSVLLQNP